jgi:hypothetical protein
MMKREIRKLASEQASIIIDIRKPLGLFYTLETGIYIDIDNSNGQAWTEEFSNLRKCKHWLRIHMYWFRPWKRIKQMVCSELLHTICVYV